MKVAHKRRRSHGPPAGGHIRLHPVALKSRAPTALYQVGFLNREERYHIFLGKTIRSNIKMNGSDRTNRVACHLRQMVQPNAIVLSVLNRYGRDVVAGSCKRGSKCKQFGALSRSWQQRDTNGTFNHHPGVTDTMCHTHGAAFQALQRKEWRSRSGNAKDVYGR